MEVRGKMSEKMSDYARKKEDNRKDIDLSNLERMAEGTSRLVAKSVSDSGLGNSLTSLYMAESIGDRDPAMSQVAYLSAMLGIEKYIAQFSIDETRGCELQLTEEAERYLGICRELSEYCRSKTSYLGQGAGKGMDEKSKEV